MMYTPLFRRRTTPFRSLMSTLNTQKPATKPMSTVKLLYVHFRKRWESFTPIKRKASLVLSLVHRALMICSKSKLKGEITRIKEILLDNGYPAYFFSKQLSKKIKQVFSLKRFGPDKCLVYLQVTYTGKASLTWKKYQNRG